MNPYNAANQGPSKKLLTLTAVCLSVILAVSAYKIALAVRNSAEKAQNNIIASASDNAPTIETTGNKVLNALQQAQLEATTTGNPFAPNKDDTLTDRLSKNFFASYAQNQLASNANPDMQTTDSDAETIANNALASVDTSTMPKSKYSLSSLTITAGASVGELRAYGNTFAAIQDEEFKKISDNPGKYKNDLNAIAPIYRNIGERLAHIQVPVGVSVQHLQLVNDYILSADMFPLISAQSKDPLKALIAMRAYKDASTRQNGLYTEIADYLESNAILFNKTEPGFFWAGMTTDSNVSTTDTGSNQAK